MYERRPSTLCLCLPLQPSQETCWSKHLKLGLLKGPWRTCHPALVFSRLIRSSSSFSFTVFFFIVFFVWCTQPPHFFSTNALPTCSRTKASARYPSHNHFKSGQHLVLLPGMLTLAICGSQRQLDSWSNGPSASCSLILGLKGIFGFRLMAELLYIKGLY